MESLSRRGLLWQGASLLAPQKPRYQRGVGPAPSLACRFAHCFCSIRSLIDSHIDWENGCVPDIWLLKDRLRLTCARRRRAYFQLEAMHRISLCAAPRRSDAATGPAPCSSNSGVLYFSRRRPCRPCARGSSISLALPVPGKVNFSRATFQHPPDSLSGDGNSALGRLPHRPFGGSVCR